MFLSMVVILMILTLHDNLKAIAEIVIEDKNLENDKINYLNFKI